MGCAPHSIGMHATWQCPCTVLSSRNLLRRLWDGLHGWFAPPPFRLDGPYQLLFPTSWLEVLGKEIVLIEVKSYPSQRRIAIHCSSLPASRKLHPFPFQLMENCLEYENFHGLHELLETRDVWGHVDCCVLQWETEERFERDRISPFGHFLLVSIYMTF